MKLFSIALLLLMGSLASGELAEARKQEIANHLSAHPYSNVYEYPDEEKVYIENWILNIAKREPGTREDTYDKQLLQIGHRPTIEKYGTLMTKGGVHVYIRDSFQPRLIKYYESWISINEPAWMMQGGDTTAWRTSTSGAAGMLGLLSSSPELRTEVRVWARDLLAQINELASDRPKARKGLEEARGIVCQWWAENKQAVVEERFADVRPSKVHSFILEKQPKPASIEPAESVVKRPEPRDESSGAPKAAQEVAEAPKESSNWYWVVPAVCVALLVGLVAAFRKKR